MGKSGSPNNPDQQPDRRGTPERSKPDQTGPRKIPPPFRPGKQK